MIMRLTTFMHQGTNVSIIKFVLKDNISNDPLD